MQHAAILTNRVTPRLVRMCCCPCWSSSARLL